MDPEAQFPQSDGVVWDDQRQFSAAAVDFLQDTFQTKHIITLWARSLQQLQEKHWNEEN